MCFEFIPPVNSDEFLKCKQQLRTRLGWLKIHHHFIHTNIVTSYFIIKDFQLLCLYIWSNSQRPAVWRPKIQSLLILGSLQLKESHHWEGFESCGWIIHSSGVSAHLSCHRLHMGRCWNSSEQLISHPKERRKAQTKKDLLNSWVGCFSLPMNADLSCANQQQTLRSCWAEVKQQCIYSLTNSAISILHSKEMFPEVRGSSKLGVLIPTFSRVLAESLCALQWGKEWDTLTKLRSHWQVPTD